MADKIESGNVHAGAKDDAPAVSKTQAKKNKKAQAQAKGPTPAAETKAITSNTKIPNKLAPPSMKQENDKRAAQVKTTEESLFSASIFHSEVDFKCAVRELEFSPSMTGWTPTTDVVMSELRNDKGIQVSKDLPVEALRYYNAGLFWLRSIGLKLEAGSDLTDAEAQVERAFKDKTLAILEPQFLGLKTIGRVTTRNGEILFPTLPDLPNTVTGETPGGCGVAAAANHNLYEEYPVMGPAFQGCVERAARGNGEAAVYNSVFAAANSTANRNMQGFNSLRRVRPECIALLNDMGFGDAAPRTIANTGISYNAMKTVSNLLEKVTIFRVQHTNPITLPATGSMGQIVITKPVTADLIPGATYASSTNQTATCASKENRSTICITEVYGLCQFKESALEGDEWLRPSVWSCCTFTEAHPQPAAWTANRNERRNLPDRFTARVFYTSDQNPEDVRKTTIDRMAKIQS